MVGVSFHRELPDNQAAGSGGTGEQPASSVPTRPWPFVLWTFKVFFWAEVIAVACWAVPPMFLKGGVSMPALVGGALFLLWMASWVVLPVLLFSHLVAMISGAILRCFPSSRMRYMQGSTPGWRGFLVTLVVIAGVVGAGVGAYQLSWSLLTFRLKATATILVNGVERTGSSVQEFQLHRDSGGQIIPVYYSWDLKMRGEAVRIDIPGEEPIYVTMYADNVYDNCAARRADPDEIKASLLQITRCEVRPRSRYPDQLAGSGVYPPAVRFDGSGNYDEAIPVYVGGKNVEGYQFVSMTYERTNDPITEGRVPVELWGHKGSGVKVTREVWVPKGRVLTSLGVQSVPINTHFKLEDFW